MLEKAQSDHCQDGVVAQSCPVPALQMIEAEFLLHLLVAGLGQFRRQTAVMMIRAGLP
jgi:hypothetical protein